MPVPFQRFCDGALEAARQFFLLHILHRIGLNNHWTDPSEPWLINDDEMGLLQHIQEPIKKGEQIDGPCHTSDDQISYTQQDRRDVCSERYHFPAGDSKIIAVIDEHGQNCFANVINQRLMESLGDMLNKLARCEAKEIAISKLKQKQTILTAHTDRICATGQEDDPAQGLQQYNDYIDKLDGKIQLYRNQIRAIEGSSGSDQRRIFRILEAAIKAAGLLQHPIIQEENILSGDEELEALLAGEAVPEVVLTDDERVAKAEQQRRQDLLDAASETYNEVSHKIYSAQMQFDNKEEYEKSELACYIAELADGKADETRSDFDVRMLQYGMYWTGQIVDAEIELDEVKVDLARCGICITEFGELEFADVQHGNPDGPIENLPGELDADQVDAYDFEPPMENADRSRVDVWMESVDQSEDPESMPSKEEVVHDEWRASEPEIHDSFSMVDDGPSGKQIGQWQMMCEEHRQHWRADFPTGSPQEKYGHPLKRSMSF